MKKEDIVKKWYRKLGFSAGYDNEFYQCLAENNLADLTDFSSYDPQKNTPQRNLLACLYFCEELQKQYKNRGIPNDILILSLQDLVLWNDSYYAIHQRIGLDEFPWINRTFEMTIFRLGRLQFSMFPSAFDIAEIHLHKGNPVLEVHIPRGEPLTYGSCQQSFKRAKEFFEKYYPNYPQEWCICDSWLLDDKILPLLGDHSNIATFQTFFKVLGKAVSDYCIRFTFRWDATRENIAQFSPTSRFAKELKQSVLSGEQYYEALGIHRLAGD